MGWLYRRKHALHARFRKQRYAEEASRHEEIFGNWSWTTPAREHVPTEIVDPGEERRPADAQVAVGHISGSVETGNLLSGKTTRLSSSFYRSARSSISSATKRLSFRSALSKGPGLATPPQFERSPDSAVHLHDSSSQRTMQRN